MKRLVLILVMVFVGMGVISAEIAPWEYRRMQENAADQVVISVLRVSTRRPLFSRKTSVTVQGEIVEVISSYRRLSDGDRITISYTHEKPRIGWAGPRPIPLVQRGEITHAFIEFDTEGNVYVPAARGASFEPLITY